MMNIFTVQITMNEYHVQISSIRRIIYISTQKNQINMYKHHLSAESLSVDDKLNLWAARRRFVLVVHGVFFVVIILFLNIG